MRGSFSSAMFQEINGSRKAIGDVDVLWHDGLFHLFHLVLPNHDFIAHAVSTDGIHWRRVRNALFIGDPGSWDDLMLWTMHVSSDPHEEGQWRMFYTGLSRRERGKVQRIGLATSRDLYHWEKYPVAWEDGRGASDPELVQKARGQSRQHQIPDRNAPSDESSCFPLEADPEFYEANLDQGRSMVSFRDPFWFQCQDGGSHLLVAGRVPDGPVTRRGAVAHFVESGKNCFHSRPPMLAPGLYDDVEVPNLIHLDDHYFLIGSLREDAKIRYWHAEEVGDKWRSYHDNVLLPQGNYAGRVSTDEHGLLLWCFYSMNQADRTADNLMPPPKRLSRAENGLLVPQTFEALLDWPSKKADTKLEEGGTCGSCSRTSGKDGSGTLLLSSESSFLPFWLAEESASFRLDAEVRLNGKGKCGILFRIDPETEDGYYLSLDLCKGFAQMRAWGGNHQATGEDMMSFHTLQSGQWEINRDHWQRMRLIAFGSYLELSVNERILLSLVDRRYHTGLVGLYLETADLHLRNLRYAKLDDPDQFDDQLIEGRHYE